MRAPLPPPARPPMRAPPPAPPPIMAAVRLPLPLRKRLTELVCTSYAPPFIVTESRASLRTAPPLKRPRGTACTTLPEASAPLGTATLPSTSIGVATLAVSCGWSKVIREKNAEKQRTARYRDFSTCAGEIFRTQLAPYGCHRGNAEYG